MAGNVTEPGEDVEAEWADEVELRIRQIDAGEVELIPWDEVRGKLHALLNAKRSVPRAGRVRRGR